MLWIRTLLFIIICGVEEVDLTGHVSVGGTVKLPSVLGSLKVKDFDFLKWRFNRRIIAEMSSGQPKENLHAQFKGRLQLSPDFNLTVRELRLEDSGEYEREGMKEDGSQIPSYKIQLHVYEIITGVHIQSKVSWLHGNHTCMVHLVCNSSGNPEPSFSWKKGGQTENSKEIYFFFSPEEGDISITCTAVNAVSQMSTDVNIRCSSTDWKLYLYIGLSAAVFLGVMFLVVHCCRRRNQATETSRNEATVYSTVDEGCVKQSHESEGHGSPITLYETIGELNVKPETVYDRVDLNRSCAPALSPLKKVL